MVHIWIIDSIATIHYSLQLNCVFLQSILAEILKIQGDVISEIQRCESGPEILNIQKGFISDVW